MLHNSLIGAAAALASISNPAQATALNAQIIKPSDMQQQSGWTYQGQSPNGKSLMWTDKTGAQRFTAIPAEYQKADTPDKVATPSAAVSKLYNDQRNTLVQTAGTADRAGALMDALVAGKLDPTMLKRADGYLQGLTGTSDENTANIKDVTKVINEYVNDIARSKYGGKITNDQRVGLLNSILPAGNENDPALLYKALSDLRGQSMNYTQSAGEGLQDLHDQFPVLGKHFNVGGKTSVSDYLTARNQATDAEDAARLPRYQAWLDARQKKQPAQGGFLGFMNSRVGGQPVAPVAPSVPLPAYQGTTPVGQPGYGD